MPKKAAKKATKKSPKSVSDIFTDEQKAKGFKKNAVTSVDLLSDAGGALVESVATKIREASMRRKNRPINLIPLSEVRKSCLPLRHFALQWLTDSFGLRHGTLVEILGSDGIGKSTLANYFLGCGILSGAPALSIECEGKPILPERVQRAMHTNPELAALMVRRISFAQAHSLDQMTDVLDNWVDQWRGGKGGVQLPISQPLIALVDPWSKLLSKDEALGFHDYGKNLDAEQAKKFKDTGGESNFGHAKYAQSWSRRLATMLSTQNVILILVHHQNDDIDMGGGFSPVQLPQIYKDLRNREHRGGRGLNQLCALQLIMAASGDVRAEDKSVRGKKVSVRVEKNSYGPHNRMINMELRDVHEGYDRPGYLDPAWHMDAEFAKWMADKQYLGVRATDGMYTLEEAGLIKVMPEIIGAHVNSSDDLKNKLGALLKVDGYSQIADEVLASAGEVAVDG